MNPIVVLLPVAAVTVLLYLFGIRPWQLTWGATRDEVRQSLPGDDVVKNPHFVATRAVTIQASPEEIWKWIIQIGSARAGFYSIDLLDNANVPSSREILPQFQQIAVDTYVPFTPDQKNGMWVKAFTEPNYILWWDKKGNGTWGWYLHQTQANETRLVSSSNPGKRNAPGNQAENPI